MYEYIFTIGCFDRLHKGHIKLLKQLKSECNKLIIGIHYNYSIDQIKKITDIQPLDERSEAWNFTLPIFSYKYLIYLFT